MSELDTVVFILGLRYSGSRSEQEGLTLACVRFGDAFSRTGKEEGCEFSRDDDLFFTWLTDGKIQFGTRTAKMEVGRTKGTQLIA